MIAGMFGGLPGLLQAVILPTTKLEDLALNLEKRGLAYSTGTAASEAEIREVERCVGVVLPAQARIFYQHCNGLLVEHPALQITFTLASFWSNKI